MLIAARLGTTSTFDRKFRSRFDSRIKTFSIKSSVVTIKSVNDRLHLIHHKSTQFSNRFWINAALRHSLHHQRKRFYGKLRQQMEQFISTLTESRRKYFKRDLKRVLQVADFSSQMRVVSGKIRRFGVTYSKFFRNQKLYLIEN